MPRGRPAPRRPAPYAVYAGDRLRETRPSDSRARLAPPQQLVLARHLRRGQATKLPSSDIGLLGSASAMTFLREHLLLVGDSFGQIHLLDLDQMAAARTSSPSHARTSASPLASPASSPASSAAAPTAPTLCRQQWTGAHCAGINAMVAARRGDSFASAGDDGELGDLAPMCNGHFSGRSSSDHPLFAGAVHLFAVSQATHSTPAGEGEGGGPKPLHSYDEHKTFVTDLDMHADGNLLVSCGLDRQVLLYHASSRDSVLRLATDDLCHTARFVGDHPFLLAVAADRDLRLLDLRMHTAFLEGPDLERETTGSSRASPVRLGPRSPFQQRRHRRPLSAAASSASLSSASAPPSTSSSDFLAHHPRYASRQGHWDSVTALNLLRSPVCSSVSLSPSSQPPAPAAAAAAASRVFVPHRKTYRAPFQPPGEWEEMYFAAPSADGLHLLAASDVSLKLWSLADGSGQHTYTGLCPHSFSAIPARPTFACHDQLVVTGDGVGQICLWPTFGEKGDHLELDPLGKIIVSRWILIGWIPSIQLQPPPLPPDFPRAVRRFFNPLCGCKPQRYLLGSSRYHR